MKFFFYIVFLCSMAVAAQPSESYSLAPVTDGYNSHYASSLVYFENESARITMNYNNTSGDFFEFFAVIENKNDTSVLFEPLDIYAEMYHNEDSLSAEPEIRYSADPDQQIEYIDKEITDLTEQNTINTGASCLFSGLSFALSVAAHEPPDTSILEAGEEEADEISYRISVLEDEKAFWENEVIRGTVIHTGGKTAGSFFIPVSQSSKWVKVIIPFGESEYVFNFRQSKI